MEIVNYPNYLVYEDGRVFNKKRRKMLKPYLNLQNGYYQVDLCKDGERKVCRVNRLVAKAYIPNPDNKPQVDHIDRVRTNNHVSNLRWVTESENQQNTIVFKNNKLGIKNISWDESIKRYCYKKTLRGDTHKNWFKTLDEAVAYKNEYEKMIEDAETLVSLASS